MRVVAYNIVGPALPQAFRVLQYQYDMPDGTARGKEDPDTLAMECPEEHSPSVIMSDEKKCKRIWSQKDHTSKRSVPTPEELWCFCRAMYRIMFYTKLFPWGRYSFQDFVDLGDDTIKLIQCQRTAVLKENPTDELRQIYAVVQFLRGILEEVAEAENDTAIESSMVDILLSCGPTSVWVKPPKDDDDKEPPTKWILDLIIGGNDTCSQCATPGGLKLLTEANWHRIDVNPVMFLKNRLKHNITVQTPFQAVLASFRQQHHHTDEANNSWDDDEWLGPWIGGVFDMPRISGREWDGWKQDGLYCQPCLRKFLDEHVWQWFLWERVKGGWVPLEDFSIYKKYGTRLAINNGPRLTPAKGSISASGAGSQVSGV
ncbi:hypothetical protein DFH08DRAFT_804119 [Mycena albidolilacea]|uniref:Uncharacterized protein n=1 Tax=Mycena albidolilacea TaxID=1033008 RepID=A0AAD7ABY7_9AGAR|nr:hypothetical protein DFH08DRAFT_804119 [Mycena albidolilacea]